MDYYRPHQSKCQGIFIAKKEDRFMIGQNANVPDSYVKWLISYHYKIISIVENGCILPSFVRRSVRQDIIFILFVCFSSNSSAFLSGHPIIHSQNQILVCERTFSILSLLTNDITEIRLLREKRKLSQK